MWPLSASRSGTSSTQLSLSLTAVCEEMVMWLAAVFALVLQLTRVLNSTSWSHSNSPSNALASSSSSSAVVHSQSTLRELVEAADVAARVLRRRLPPRELQQQIADFLVDPHGALEWRSMNVAARFGCLDLLCVLYTISTDRSCAATVVYTRDAMDFATQHGHNCAHERNLHAHDTIKLTHRFRFDIANDLQQLHYVPVSTTSASSMAERTTAAKRHKTALSLDGKWFSFHGLLAAQRELLTQQLLAANGQLYAPPHAVPTDDAHAVVYVLTDYWASTRATHPPLRQRTSNSTSTAAAANLPTLVAVTAFWLSEMVRLREWLAVDAHVFFTPPPLLHTADKSQRLAYPEDYDRRLGIGSDAHTHFSPNAPLLPMHLPCAPANCFRDHVPLWPYYVAFLHAPMRNVYELADVLKRITGTDVRRRFNSLEVALNDMLTPDQRARFFESVLPAMVQLVLELPTLFATRPAVLGPICNTAPNAPFVCKHSVTFTKRETLALVASCFFCVFPSQSRVASVRDTGSSADAAHTIDIDFPFFTMRPLFGTSGGTGRYGGNDVQLKAHKLRCILAYFLRVVPLVLTRDNSFISECVTFTRVSVTPRLATAAIPTTPHELLSAITPASAASEHAAAAARVTIETHRLIEDMSQHLQIDFANKFAGGGVFNSGCVQEEIRFLLSPELLVACLIVAKLEPTEAFVVVGTERYARYRGYGATFEFAGDYIDTTPVIAQSDAQSKRRASVVVGIDAVDYGGNAVARQFGRHAIWRDVVKAVAGFCYSEVPEWPIATGNWGCGVFRGDPELKFLIQWLAASVAKRELTYVLLARDDALRVKIDALLELLNGVADNDRVVLLLAQFLFELEAILTRRAAAMRSLSGGKRPSRPSVLALATEFFDTHLEGLKRLRLSSPTEATSEATNELASSSVLAADAPHGMLSPPTTSQSSTQSSPAPHDARTMQQQTITKFFSAQ